jgi:hypothetical protein
MKTALTPDEAAKLVTVTLTPEQGEGTFSIRLANGSWLVIPRAKAEDGTEEVREIYVLPAKRFSAAVFPA